MHVTARTFPHMFRKATDAHVMAPKANSLLSADLAAHVARDRNEVKQRLAVADNMSGPYAEFPEPWCPGAVSCGFEVIPITNNSELYREGALLHHCVGTYADRVRLGETYIYSVRRAGERIATLELIKSRSGVAIGQLRGPCNSHAPKKLSAQCIPRSLTPCEK